MHAHAIQDNAEQCQVLIGAKADVNATNGKGNTALMEAVRWGSPLSAEVLLAAGVDISIKNQQGETALTIAPVKDEARDWSEGNAKCKVIVGRHQNLRDVRLIPCLMC